MCLETVFGTKKLKIQISNFRFRSFVCRKKTFQISDSQSQPKSVFFQFNYACL